MASVCVPALKTISGSPTRQRSTNTRCPNTAPNGGIAPTSYSRIQDRQLVFARQAKCPGARQHPQLVEIDDVVGRQDRLNGLFVEHADDDFGPAVPADV